MKSYVKNLWSPLLFLVLGYLGVALMIWYTGEKSEKRSKVADAEELIIVQPKAEYLPHTPMAKPLPKAIAKRAPRPEEKPSQSTAAKITGPLADKVDSENTAIPIQPQVAKPEPGKIAQVELHQDTTKAVPAKPAALASATVKTATRDTVQNKSVAVTAALNDSSAKTVAMAGDTISNRERPGQKATVQIHEQRLSLDQEKIYDDVLNMLREKLAQAQSKEQPQRPPQVATAGEVMLAANMTVVPIRTSKPGAAIFRRHGLRVAAANLHSFAAQTKGGPGAKVGYMFRDNAKISMNVDLGVNPLSLNKKSVSMLTGDLYGQLHFRNSNRLQPTLSLGFGANRLQAGAFSQPQVIGSVCAGGGMDYKLSDQLTLNSSIQYRQLLNEIKVASSGQRDSFISLQVGLTILFGGGHDSTLSIDNSLMADNK